MGTEDHQPSPALPACLPAHAAAGRHRATSHADAMYATPIFKQRRLRRIAEGATTCDPAPPPLPQPPPPPPPTRRLCGEISLPSEPASQRCHLSTVTQLLLRASIYGDAFRERGRNEPQARCVQGTPPPSPPAPLLSTLAHTLLL